MNEKLAEYYYEQAFLRADANDLTAALQFLNRSLEFMPEHDLSQRLKMLCLRQLGLVSLENDVDAQRRSEGRALIQKQKYKKASKLLENIQEKKVMDYQLLGCLYSVLGRKEIAVENFSTALGLDCSNPQTLKYLQHVSQIKKKWWF